jgi:hypothetical protein
MSTVVTVVVADFVSVSELADTFSLVGPKSQARGERRMFGNRKPQIDLRKILLHHEQALLAELGARELFDHPTAKGDLGEGPWHRVLSEFLPERYQVSRAFVLDARGDCSDQIDLVIHDRHFCPLLFEQDDQRYIPAESVFAAFEVKPALDKAVVEYAKAKAQSVRRLYRTNRPLVDRGVTRPPREPFPIIAGVLAVESHWSSPFGQPLLEALADADADRHLQLGCAPKHGAFEALHDGKLRLEISEAEGALMFFLLRLFHLLQQIGSPMAIDLREYSRRLKDADIESEASAA